MVKRYFTKLEEQINYFQSIINTYSITAKYYNSNKGFILGNITFVDNSKLTFREVKDIEINYKDKYSYHYMNSLEKMIFRYDNAYHYKELETFPHHKHTSTKIENSNEPELIDILHEISKILNKI